jgi:hypothetical protein
MAHEPWSEDKFAALKAMRAEGMPVNTIAGLLGMTRGSVTGKLHRAGLCERTPHLSKPKGSNRVVPLAAAPARPDPPLQRENGPVLAEAALVEPISPRVAAVDPKTALRLVDLQVGQCRWVCNDPRDEGGALFCGHRAIPGKSWCRTHHAVVFQPWHARRVA